MFGNRGQQGSFKLTSNVVCFQVKHYYLPDVTRGEYCMGAGCIPAAILHSCQCMHNNTLSVFVKEYS